MVLFPIGDSIGGLLCHCPGVSGYSAAVGNNLIPGWPFLVAYQLMPCPLKSCLTAGECVTVDFSQLRTHRQSLPADKDHCEDCRCCALFEGPSDCLAAESTPTGGAVGDHSLQHLYLCINSGLDALHCFLFLYCLLILVCFNGDSCLICPGPNESSVCESTTVQKNCHNSCAYKQNA